jgi:hypothetical protein
VHTLHKPVSFMFQLVTCNAEWLTPVLAKTWSWALSRPKFPVQASHSEEGLPVC